MLTRALTEAAFQMGEIGQRFLTLCRNLLQGHLTAQEELRDCIGLALDGYGGIICAPLHYMKRFNPHPMDVGLLMEIQQGLDAFLEGVRSLCAVCGIPRAFLRRFNIRHDSLFTPGFFESHRPMFFHENAERLAVYRARLIEHVCATFRAFLAWVRTVIDEVVRLVAHRAEALALPRRLVPCKAMQGLVALADQILGLVVLCGEDGEATEVFRIGKDRQGAWKIIRLLVEECDDDGAVALPRLYASNFQTKDAAGDTINDDLTRLHSHILPVGGGRYRLSLATKPPLLRGR